MVQKMSQELEILMSADTLEDLATTRQKILSKAKVLQKRATGEETIDIEPKFIEKAIQYRKIDRWIEKFERFTLIWFTGLFILTVLAVIKLNSN